MGGYTSKMRKVDADHQRGAVPYDSTTWGYFSLEQA